MLKTTRQTAPTTITYREAAKQVIDQDGLKGLFARGLGTRLLTNAVQASLFTVVWKCARDARESSQLLAPSPARRSRAIPFLTVLPA